MSSSVPSMFLISSRPPTIFASQRTTRSATARPSSPRTTASGARPPRMAMPSAWACSISCRLACILSTAKIEVSVTSAPCLAETSATSCAAWPAIACSGRSLGLIFSMWPRRRDTVATSIDVSPPPTTTTRLPTWRSRPSLKAFRKAVAVTQFGASAPSTGSARPACAPRPRNTASKSARICAIVTSVPMRQFMRVCTPRSRMRWISASSTCRGVRKPGMP